MIDISTFPGHLKESTLSRTIPPLVNRYNCHPSPSTKCHHVYLGLLFSYSLLSVRIFPGEVPYLLMPSSPRQLHYPHSLDSATNALLRPGVLHHAIRRYLWRDTSALADGRVSISHDFYLLTGNGLDSTPYRSSSG